MKFGVREICDVVLKAKATQKVGNKIFYKNEPVIYFDTLKTSSLEGAATQVYATGGRGNARLVSWEGERTVTFTMEDALISPEGFMILSGAGLIEATTNNTIKQHVTERIDNNESEITYADGSYTIKLRQKPYLPASEGGNFAYVMFVKDDEIISEPFIPTHYGEGQTIETGEDDRGTYYNITVVGHDNYDTPANTEDEYTVPNLTDYSNRFSFDSVIVDYYVEKPAAAQQIEITADKFGGNYYLEASTLFRTQNGVDMPAEFIIPNCKVQSNFTFTMASSGDPSTFTFTMDAFPDYTRFDHSKKVLAAIQIIEDRASGDHYRVSTDHAKADELLFN